MSDVKESSEYDNFIGKTEVKKTVKLTEFLGVEDEDDVEEWRKHWKDMPEFQQEEDRPFKTIYVHFRTKEDYEEFAKVIDQKLTDKTKSIWHPKLDITKNSLLRWIEDDAE